MCVEFEKQGIPFETEKELKIFYQDVEVGSHRLDLLVENEIVVEIKAVEEILGKFYSQVRSYLKAINKEIGLLVNFGGNKIDVRRVERGKK